MLKPVLIGFLLGLMLVGYARLSSPADDSGPQLTGTNAEDMRRGAAFRHVSADPDCGSWLRPPHILA
ncbi:hypothetical protein [Sandaracinobacteroides hominis]|uniref:hypothetical protein n=1 Tax=Sandaracinobacteroides hominis TaxID=2780086 RepID=UPI0018F500E1|nr:hypothetical protein [Sandaracinobacteroides hominis]